MQVLALATDAGAREVLALVKQGIDEGEMYTEEPQVPGYVRRWRLRACCYAVMMVEDKYIGDR